MESKLVSLFRKVQRIPYQVCKFNKTEINENLEYGDCRHKHYLLKQLLDKEGYEVSEVKVIFDWKDLPIPAELLAILKNSGTTWDHNSLKVRVNGKWIKVDCTWNLELKKKGFPVTEDWDGNSDTKQITNGKLKFYDVHVYSKKIKIDKQEAMNFAKALNEYLGS